MSRAPTPQTPERIELLPCPVTYKLAEFYCERREVLAMSAQDGETPFVFYDYGVKTDGGLCLPIVKNRTREDAAKIWNSRHRPVEASPLPGDGVTIFEAKKWWADLIFDPRQSNAEHNTAVIARAMLAAYSKGVAHREQEYQRGWKDGRNSEAEAQGEAIEQDTAPLREALQKAIQTFPTTSDDPRKTRRYMEAHKVMEQALAAHPTKAESLEVGD